ncbi:MAG: hypothetical protein ACWGHH_06615 [Sulfurovaceae bacterium]
MITEEMMSFKKRYMERMARSSVRVVLTPYDVQRKDYWSERLFGSSEYAWMFDLLIHNVDDALENGYWVAV